MAKPLRNADVAAVLREIALFLQMEDEPFKPRAYEAGTWGPEAADLLLSRTGRKWNTRDE